MSDYRRKSIRKKGGMVTSLSRLGQMVPKAAASTIPRGFSAFSAMNASIATKATPLYQTNAILQKKTTSMAKSAFNTAKKEEALRAAEHVTQVRELLRLFTETGDYGLVKAQLLNNNRYARIKNLLKDKSSPLHRKTLKWMVNKLEPEQLIDYVKTFLFPGKEFKRSVKDIRARLMIALGINRTNLAEIFESGERLFWDKIKVEVERQVQDRQGIIYSSIIHRWEHTVELQTIMTAVIDLNLRDLAGAPTGTNVKEQLNAYYREFDIRNAFLLADIERIINSKDYVYIKSIGLNDLKEEVTNKIICRQKISLNEPIFYKYTDEVQRDLKLYILETVIPNHENLIEYIESNYNGNELGAVINIKLKTMIVELKRLYSNEGHRGGFQNIEEMQPALDESIKYEVFNLICEDLKTDDSIHKISLKDYMLLNLSTFLKARTFLFDVIKDLTNEPVYKAELSGGFKTRKNRQRR
jgi:hypothetical protein